MADGDERDENSQENQRSNGTAFLDIENLQVADLSESDNLEAVVIEPSDGYVISEYLNLDGQLSQLDACLDSLEARNDSLVTKLKAFLLAGQSQDGETGKDAHSKNDHQPSTSSDNSRENDTVLDESSASSSRSL